ncbi:MAG: 16S rRNA (adenine(1518)-N(6)/adenine(1519)-N(6))-dimethyltransferase RsmA, partial [Gammaproteobacteria bacterium]
PRKRFGQHFLHDKHVIDRIIDNINLESDTSLVEIGPGRGALTLPLLARKSPLHVIEIDNDLADRLETGNNQNGQLIVYRGDALKFDFCKMLPGRLTIVGNLPYNISTPLLFHLLRHTSCIDEMLFMLQKEVADRICANPGASDYGRLSIMVQSVCRVQHLFDVSAASFTPPPKVESSIIRLSPANDLATTISDYQLFSIIVRTAFSKRRKTIRNALKNLATEEMIVAAGVSPDSRPEQLSVQTYADLANIIHQYAVNENSTE